MLMLLCCFSVILQMKKQNKLLCFLDNFHLLRALGFFFFFFFQINLVIVVVFGSMTILFFISCLQLKSFSSPLSNYQKKKKNKYFIVIFITIKFRFKWNSSMHNPYYLILCYIFFSLTKV